MAKTKDETPVATAEVPEIESVIEVEANEGADPYLEAVVEPASRPHGSGIMSQKPSEQVLDDKLSEPKFIPDQADMALSPEKWIEKHLRLAAEKDLHPKIWEDDFAPGTWRFEVKGRETMIGIGLIHDLKRTKPERVHSILRALLGGILPEYRPSVN